MSFLLGLTACNSLWTPFSAPNPLSCVATPGSCPEGQVCNAQTRLCEDHSLSLVAGATGGPGSADDIGAAARFNGPIGVASDAAGNLYVSDFGSNTIRKVVLSTGAVTTLAGSPGMRGSTDGIGSVAQFNEIQLLATDGVGNLYVADWSNHTIRKVVLSTGVVTTLAGSAGVRGSTNGTGSAALFDGPIGVATDGVGNLYVTELYNHTIRKVVLSTGAVSIVAGSAGMPGSADGISTAARFNGPTGVTADGAGNLYVADNKNHTIRKVVLSTGAVTTFAGSAGMAGGADGTGAAARFNSPESITTDGAGLLYVTDTNNHTVRTVLLSTGAVSTLAGSAGVAGSTDSTRGAARFNAPGGVTTDGAGNLYVADNKNHTIRKVELSTGVVTTLAGSASRSGSIDGPGLAARFSAPYGLEAEGTDHLYIADSANHAIRKVVLSTSEVTTLAGSAGKSGSANGRGVDARFSGPYGVAADGAGSLYVADTANHTIRKVELNTGAVTTVAGGAGMFGSTDGTSDTARFKSPADIAVDSSGSLYVADRENHTIRKVELSTGVVTTLAGTAGTRGSANGMGTAAQFAYPVGMAVDGTGFLYVADTYNHAIRKVELSTGAVTTLAGSLGLPGNIDGTGEAARFNKPLGVAFDGAGNLYVTDTDNHTIRKIALASASVTTVAGIAGQGGVKLGPLPGRLGSPIGIAVLPTGEIFVASNSENAILKLH